MGEYYFPMDKKIWIWGTGNTADMYQEGLRRWNRYDRIRVFPYGVSSESDTVMLEHLEETNGSGSKIVTGKERDDLNRIRTITIDDFIQIPKLIKNILPDYRLFLRQHAESWCDTVLYAM